MSGPACLATIEDVIDGAGVAPRIEALLPAGVRHRQLKVRTLLLGMHLAMADGRNAHLTRVHQALTGLPGPDQVRLGVIEDWEAGPHQLPYRQTRVHLQPGHGRAGKRPPRWQPIRHTRPDLR